MRWLMLLTVAGSLAAQTAAKPGAPAPAATASVSAATPSVKDLRFPPLKPVKVPEPVVFTLSNGIKVFLLENRELPLVNGFALVRTGNLFDPPDKRGLSEIMAGVMRSGGTKSKTGDQLDEELENVAASVESSMGETSATVNFSALKEHTAKVLAIFKDVLTSPEFRQDKIDLLKTQVRSGISRRNDDPNGIAQRELLAQVYGPNTPYGWRVEYEHIDRITREDLIAFHRRYYFPANVRIAIAGDFDAGEMRRSLEAVFGDWKSQQPAVPPFPQVETKPRRGVFLADKPDVTQTFFRLGHLGGVLKDKDYPALQVAADILGSGFTSRLVNRVRTKLGYAYEIGAGWGAEFQHPGVFQIGGSTKSASTVDALRVIQEEVERMRTSEVTARELETAKNAVLNSFVFRFDQPEKTLNRLVQYDYHGYPADFLRQYQKGVDSVTRADVLRVAKEHFRPEWLTIVAVGNAKEFGKPLSEIGAVQAIDLSIPEPKAAGAPPAQAGGDAKALFGKMQAALGGAKQLESVRDMTYTLESKVATGVTIRRETRFLAPSHFRQDQEVPAGRVIVYSDGQTGWFSGPQGVQAIPPQVMEQMRGEISRQWISLGLADRDAQRQISSPRPNTIRVAKPGTPELTIELDAETGLPVKWSYSVMGRTGMQVVEEVFSDWRDAGGLKLPFTIAISQGGQKFADIQVMEYKFNSGYTAAELAKKP